MAGLPASESFVGWLVPPSVFRKESGDTGSARETATKKKMMVKNDGVTTMTEFYSILYCLMVSPLPAAPGT